MLSKLTIRQVNVRIVVRPTRIAVPVVNLDTERAKVIEIACCPLQLRLLTLT